MKYTYKMWKYFTEAVLEEMNLLENYRFRDQCERERRFYYEVSYMIGMWKGFKIYIQAILDLAKYSEDDIEYWYAIRVIHNAESFYYR